MPRHYPALDVTWPLRPDDERIEILLADIDDEAPLGVEELDNGLRIYFPTTTARGRAAVRLVALAPDLTCEPLEVSDENWAERSQASLGPVTVDRFVIAPPWAARHDQTPDVISVVIQPSMGFGTGHHASTRLCLRLLQQLPVAGLDVLDVGTGSGILAIAAAKLGARRVVAIDNDTDALTAARENLDVNRVDALVTLEHADLRPAFAEGFGEAHAFDIVLANLTGAMLIRDANTLSSFVRANGTLVASGFVTDEERSVANAYAGAGLTSGSRADEDGWVACSFRRA